MTVCVHGRRRSDDHGQYDLKRQCFSPTGPHNSPAARASGSPSPSPTRRGPATRPSDVQRQAGSPLASPRRMGCLPSLGEASQDDNELVGLQSAAKDKVCVLARPCFLIYDICKGTVDHGMRYVVNMQSSEEQPKPRSWCYLVLVLLIEQGGQLYINSALVFS